MSKTVFVVVAAVLLAGGTVFNYSLSDVKSGGVIYGGTRTGTGSSGAHK